MSPRWLAWVVMSGFPVLTAGGAGCGHTRRADDAPVSSEKESEAPPRKRPSTAEKDAELDSPRKPATKSSAATKPSAATESSEDGPQLATGPEGLMTEGAVEKIQDRLRERDLLKGDTSSGHWDERTRTAMRSFQRDNGLPATGMPDDVTVGKLGLKPSDVFRSTQK
jgi:hypothetical protein